VRRARRRRASPAGGCFRVAPGRTRRGARASAAAAAPATPCKSPCRRGCSSPPSTTRRRGGASAGTSSTCRDPLAGDASYTAFHRRGHKETLRQAVPMAPVERARSPGHRTVAAAVRVGCTCLGCGSRGMTRARVRVREACLPSGERWWPTARCTASEPCRHRRIAEDPKAPYHEDGPQGAVWW
jgi:hypothetical protein